MQNIFAARSEGYTTYSTYTKLGLLDNNYNFIIPVYENMPDVFSEEPKDNATNTGGSTSSNTTTAETVKVNASNVRVRKNATTSSAILAVLAKNTVVTRLEKKVANKDGYYWDKIKLANGTIGYIATNYLSTVAQSNTNTNVSITKTETVKVNASNVRMRKGATTSSKVIVKLAKNTKITRLEKKVAYKNGYYWDKVKLSNGTIGYVATNYLSSIKTSNSTETTKTVKVNKNNVRLRKSATISSKILKTLKKGTKVTVLQKKIKYKNGYYWDKVKLSNGTVGYIASKYLS